MLTDKRLIITGVVRADSTAYAVAEHAQLAGAEILLTAYPRDRASALQAAAQLPFPVEVLDVDLTRDEDLDRLAGQVRDRWAAVDGALHAVGYTPRDALGGDLLATPFPSVSLALQTSAYSYAALARILRDLAPATGAALLGLDFDAAVAWPVYNWMGVAEAALESVNRYLARDLGPRHIRANLIAAGPLHTRAATGIPDFDRLLQAWHRQAPLAWDPHDPAPVAATACFLLSDHARAITGEILHVDGGYHAMAAPLTPPEPSPPTGDPRSTKARLLQAFTTLSSYGIAALAAVGTDPDPTRTRLRAAILQQFPHALGSYVFYTAPDDHHFDPDGTLTQPLTLHISGDDVTRALHAALDQVGLHATPGAVSDTLTLTNCLTTE